MPISPKISKIANRVVTDCLQVREDEQVLISAWDHTIDYANALAIEVQKLGATPLVTLGTDEQFWGYLEEVPEKYYRKQPRAMLSALDQIDVSIWLGGPKDPSGFKKVAGDKLARSFEAEKPVMDKFRERKIRTIGLTVGQVTPQRAKTYGFSYAQWQRNIGNAINVDYAKMSVLGKKLGSSLEGAAKVEVTAKNGTNLAFEIGPRPVHVNDGVIDQDDIGKGTTNESLPSGVVYTAPVETSAEGNIVFDQPMALRGKLVKGLSLSFDSGKLTDLKAKANLKALTDFYQGSTGDKDRIASFMIGINPKARFIGYNTDEFVLGAVTVGIGNNKEFGGTNDTTFYHSQTLSKATVQVDGKTVLDSGKLRI